ncbi:SpoIIE family protein phosphatase [Blastococcus jejuensis]|uniref:SpoIIE family protein phosphatase n=1 Tax=Blastococcus jejuensis TaxID=351224 RepID=A0ABP6PPS4_9ACTN
MDDRNDLLPEIRDPCPVADPFPHRHVGERDVHAVAPVLGPFLDAMPAAFCLLDEDWRFRYLNEAAERLLQRSRAVLHATSMWDAFPGMRGGVFEASYRSAVASGEPVTFEAAHPGTGHGSFEVRAWPGPGGVAVYLLDVTDRRRAQDTARQVVERAALLAEVRAELAIAQDTESALARLARLVVPTLADGCIVTVVDREGRVHDIGSWHADPGRRPLMEQYAQVRLDTLPSASPVARALDAGTPVTESVAAVLDLMVPGPARDLLVRLGPSSATVLPLTADERTVGVLTLYQDAGRTVPAEDLATARQVASAAARAIARVHRQSQQALLAEALQRSLLTEPPDLGSTAVCARYVPAAEAAQVGGDWYDAFLQRGGDPVVVIGDVVGHDTEAAAAMGQLRGLLRGIAHYSGAGPAEVLRGLDEAIADMHTDTLATAAIARFERTGDGEPGWGRVRWANAGHPPPMLVAPDGAVQVLGGPDGDLLLGVDPGSIRAEPVVAVEPGSTLFLYTDGLIERRDRTIDDGMDRLAGLLRALAGGPLEEMCDAVLARMLPATPQDDVALVAVRLSAGPG